MPIYEYQCQSCGHLHEALRKLSDEPLLICPACGAPELRKKVSAAGFRLKGGGWYETDFKTGGKKNVAGGDDKSSSPAAAADSGKASEAKAASSATKAGDAKAAS